MKPDDIKKDKKRVYEKPALRTIDLVADEVLAVGCKIRRGSRGFQNRFSSCIFPRSCFAEGT